MKNQEIVMLVNRGFLATTSHCLDANSGFQFYKFRKAVNKAFTSIGESERELLKEAGIESAPEAFNSRMTELQSLPSRTESEEKEMEEMMRKSIAYSNLREALYDEEADIPAIHPLSYEDWRALQDENKSVSLGEVTVDVFSGQTEEMLEGILWEVPEE